MRRVAEQSHVDEGEARRAVTAVLRTTREVVNPGRQPQEDRVQARDAEPHDRVPDAGTPRAGSGAQGQLRGPLVDTSVFLPIDGAAPAQVSWTPGAR
jgi:hypothetical protein